ncbi:hypothetical protein E2562_000249 [Oryza meyeriana var. granulata]|uniref:Uncharacterized protein n=1 Tax=Oryza meyeriana var. granulata TaxID=110450 RepID=A0A6G1CMJ1_9ORYZ|nr:hypothetical protein E2562_000249 [Oryza meyeriana var. granulata]
MGTTSSKGFHWISSTLSSAKRQSHNVAHMVVHHAMELQRGEAMASDRPPSHAAARVVLAHDSSEGLLQLE